MDHLRSIGFCLGISVLSGSLVVSSAHAKERSPVPPAAKLEKVAGDIGFGEGPAWHPAGYLVFEDMARHRILKVDEKDKLWTYRDPNFGASGVIFDKDKRLVAAEGAGATGQRRISRTEATGHIKTVVDRFEGKRFNGPNDLTIDAKGRIYFTDPRYGDRKGMEMDKEAVYRVDPDGTVTRIIDTLKRPNGIVLTADRKTLLVADTPGKEDPRVLWAFDLDASGTPSKGRVVYELSGARGIDGMTIDTAGRIWAAAGQGDESGIYVLSLDRARAKASLITVLRTPEEPTNCTFGGAKRDTLYVTTTKGLYRIRTSARGVTGLPGK